MARIGDLLTGRKALSLSPRTTVLQAARSMAENRVGAMLVSEDDGSLAGIFTERDLMVRVIVAGLDPATTPLSDVMTRDVFTARPEEKVADMRREIQARHIRHLPILAPDGSVAGMLSLRDILRADLAQKAIEVESITQYIRRDELGNMG
jgi:CBS domain-containing protein